jgi:hypothetical protein
MSRSLKRKDAHSGEGICPGSGDELSVDNQNPLPPALGRMPRSRWKGPSQAHPRSSRSLSTPGIGLLQTQRRARGRRFTVYFRATRRRTTAGSSARTQFRASLIFRSVFQSRTTIVWLPTLSASRGETTPLLPEPVSRWVMTRGTTGHPKLVPGTEAHLSLILSLGARAITNFALKRDPQVLEMNVLNLNFPSEVETMLTDRGRRPMDTARGATPSSILRWGRPLSSRSRRRSMLWAEGLGRQTGRRGPNWYTGALRTGPSGA